MRAASVPVAPAPMMPTIPPTATQAAHRATARPRLCVGMIAVSVDPLDAHHGWIKDINETQATKVNFPIIADPDRKVAMLYDMIHPNAIGGKRTAADNATVRSVFVIGPDKKVKAMIVYPMSTGRNFDEVLRVIDSSPYDRSMRRIHNYMKEDPRFPGVPFALDLARTDAQRQALRFLFSSLGFGRPFVMPPGTPADRVAIIRKAFSDTFADPAFLADATKAGLFINPVPGEEIDALLARIAKMDPALIDRMTKLRQ